MTSNPSGIHARLHLGHPGFTLDVDVELPGRGVTALFGPSGSGKTSCLRCIAGLERSNTGTLMVNGESWQDSSRQLFVPPYQRPIGYVFQDANLFAHLSVRANLEFGMKRIPARDRRVAWDQAVELLGIEHLLERMPERLSGGERQRVGIARALLTSPRLLLMDEPLAALDVKRKQEILPYLERLHDELDIPLLYVSHAPDEVARLADHLVLLDEGKVVAQGALHETLARLDLPTAFGEDAGVVIESEITGHDLDYHLTRLTFQGGDVLVAQRSEAVGHRLRFRVHARDVSLTLERAEGTSISNLLPVRVEEVVSADTPAHVLVRLSAQGTPLLARITRRSADQLGVTEGKALWAQIKTVALLG
ncbi:molybdenum ABC transporter ATP-binding protein [Stutzerimonas stutzeri]|uniref:molybdenum ABC transporter ATP-binding protein n=1 Tax=Stutzerimonas stutzeri TaxID=316 RepID=UPI0002E971E4|nr:molybdenum ABC transporter ATP-binding protein [Stutzerimonas stutzeri]